MKTPRILRALAIMAGALLLSSLPVLAQPIGYASQNGGTTGGAGGPTVTVTNLTDFNAYARLAGPYIIQISGTINLGTSNVRFGSNKTIIGVGTNSGFIGNLKGVDETNVIIKNLNFTNPNSVGDGDGLTLDGCTNVWVDHCSFVQCGDGALDITHGADFVTVSWCKFSYTSNTGHNFVNLIGHSDTNAAEDTGKLRVTFHNNWWSTLSVERMPRVRFGRVHSFNNYFNAPGNNYCVRASIQSHVLSENNSFENINNPYEKFASSSSTGSQVGLIRTSGDLYVNCTNVTTFNDTVFTPPYSYSLAAASTVKANVVANAGPGGGGGGGPTVPAAPTNLGATAVSSTQINLSWTDNASDETGFLIERATGGGSFSQIATVGSNVTSYSSTGLTASTSYSYRVRATNSAGNSAYSNTATATTQASGGTAPAAPSGLSATATSSTQINLAWTDNANNETGFLIERATGGGSFAQIATVGANVTSYSSTGLTASTSYSFRVRATNGTGNSAYSNTATATTQAGGGSGTTVTFTAVAAEDGRVLESSETSNQGGSIDSTGTSSSALRVGDDSSDRQFKTILSFDTSSLPDGATIVSATIRLKRGSVSGTNPFTTHGSCFVDIKGGSGFNNNVALETTDFQAAADATQVATMSNPAADGDWSTGALNATGRGFVNKTGKTQFRVYFSLDDNDDGGNDYIGFLSGNSSTAADRPELVIVYQ